jgi:hypothetical protein
VTSLIFCQRERFERAALDLATFGGKPRGDVVGMWRVTSIPAPYRPC